MKVGYEVIIIGRVKYLVINYWLLIVAVRIQSRPSRGMCGKQSGTGADFLPVCWFPLPIPILPNAPFCQLPSGAGTLDSLWQMYQGTPSHPTLNIKNIFYLFY
jgi:hypothetical protein